MHVGGREGVIEFIIIIWRGFGGLTPSCMWGERRSNWVHLLLFGRGWGYHTLMHVGGGGGGEGVIEFIIIIWRVFGGIIPSCMWGGGKE